MTRRARIGDRVFQGVCLLAATGVALLGISRGNARAGFLGAAVLLGYAVLHNVSRRLTPTARLLTGDEADLRQRQAHYRATRVAGQCALLVAAGGVLAGLVLDRPAGLLVAGGTMSVVAAFVATLWWHLRR